jgi:hypothetical protein
MSQKYKVEEGLGTQPSIETRYNAVTAPGLGVNPTYFHAAASAGIDWRPAEGYARRGGLYELRLHTYNGRQDSSSFDRLDAEVVQHLPILRENWVLSGRALLNTTLNDADTVPFFLLPALGSASTLLGFSAWRFRDRHSLLLQGEFRWIPNPSFLDMAIFYDAGKVTSDRGELNLNGLKSDVGVERDFMVHLYTTSVQSPAATKVGASYSEDRRPFELETNSFIAAHSFGVRRSTAGRRCQVFIPTIPFPASRKPRCGSAKLGISTFSGPLV